MPASCCFDETSGTLFCPGTDYDGVPAFAEQVNAYQGRRMGYVTSPSFDGGRWMWICPATRPAAVRFGARRRNKTLAQRAAAALKRLGNPLGGSQGVPEALPAGCHYVTDCSQCDGDCQSNPHLEYQVCCSRKANRGSFSRRQLHAFRNPEPALPAGETPYSAAFAQTGSPPLEAQTLDQAGLHEQQATQVPGASPVSGRSCAIHPNIPDLVCCAEHGVYDIDRNQCMTVPSPFF